MTARGLDTTEKDTNFNGAMRDRVVLDDQIDAQSPAEVQQKLLEEQRQQQQKALEVVKQLKNPEK
jgi:hypothetical protein